MFLTEGGCAITELRLRIFCNHATQLEAYFFAVEVRLAHGTVSGRAFDRGSVCVFAEQCCEQK